MLCDCKHLQQLYKTFPTVYDKTPSYLYQVGQIRHVPLGSIIYGDNKKEWRRKVFTTVFQQPSYKQDLISPPCKNGISALGQVQFQKILQFVRTARIHKLPVLFLNIITFVLWFLIQYYFR